MIKNNEHPTEGVQLPYERPTPFQEDVDALICVIDKFTDTLIKKLNKTTS